MIVYFDLDGTLVESGPELVDSLKVLMRHNGLEPELSPYLEMRVSAFGVGSVLTDIFQYEVQSMEFLAMRNDFVRIYKNEYLLKSKVYPGVDELIRELESRSVDWGIATNKPRHLAAPLAEHLWTGYSHLICANDVHVAKPSAEMLQYAAYRHQCSTADILFVGDTSTDQKTAIAAGSKFCVANWGRGIETIEKGLPETYWLDQPADVLNLL